MKEWCMQHWFLTALLAYTIIECSFKLINKFIMSFNIICRGYPTTPLMDANGDIVHPDKSK